MPPSRGSASAPSSHTSATWPRTAPDDLVGDRGDGAARARRAVRAARRLAQQPAAPAAVSPRALHPLSALGVAAQRRRAVVSGQTAYVRPAIARRLREGPEPSFPPSLRDS